MMKKMSIREFREVYELRRILPEEAEIAAEIEAICFPPSEACPPAVMKERIACAGDCFLVVIERSSGKMVGFVNGLCTNEWTLRDEVYANASLHDPSGRNLLICSVSVLPEYRGQGIAREMVRHYLKEQEKRGKALAILTCVPSKVEMYRKFGFQDRGLSASVLGGEIWHEMWCHLNP